MQYLRTRSLVDEMVERLYNNGPAMSDQEIESMLSVGLLMSSDLASGVDATEPAYSTH